MSMKHWWSILLSLLLICSLAACGGTAPSGAGSSAADAPQLSAGGAEPSDGPEESDGVEMPAGSAEAGGAEAPVEPEHPAEGGGTLIAYFSWSGHTERMAQIIAEQTGGALFEIEPAVPYTDDYDTLLDIARQEQADHARPELASQVEDWGDYDVVFVGYPDWWSDAPMLIYSFLESYDWDGKTLIPFCTSGGSGFGRSLNQLPDSAPGAEILEGLHVSGGNVDGASEEIAAWLDGLNLA